MMKRKQWFWAIITCSTWILTFILSLWCSTVETDLLVPLCNFFCSIIRAWTVLYITYYCWCLARAGCAIEEKLQGWEHVYDVIRREIVVAIIKTSNTTHINSMSGILKATMVMLQRSLVVAMSESKLWAMAVWLWPQIVWSHSEFSVLKMRSFVI